MATISLFEWLNLCSRSRAWQTNKQTNKNKNTKLLFLTPPCNGGSPPNFAWRWRMSVPFLHPLDFLIRLNCFVGNLTDFPAVKEFWKSVKIWRNHRHKSIARFLGTQYVILVAYYYRNRARGTHTHTHEYTWKKEIENTYMWYCSLQIARLQQKWRWWRATVRTWPWARQ